MINHGTIYAYQEYGCRCAQCTLAMRARWRRDTVAKQRKRRHFSHEDGATCPYCTGNKPAWARRNV